MAVVALPLIIVKIVALRALSHAHIGVRVRIRRSALAFYALVASIKVVPELADMAFIRIGTPAGLTGPVTDRYTVLKRSPIDNYNLIVASASRSIDAGPVAFIFLVVLEAGL